jgi:clan AA aspartic protease (TIGR02281 family)
MRFFRFIAAAVVVCFVSLLCADEPAAPDVSNLTPAQAKETLEKLGLKVSATSVVMPAEQEFYKSMSELEAVRKKYLAAEKEFQATEAESAKIEKTITQGKSQLVQMNAAMAGGRLPVAEHNRIVGLINATGGQIDLLIGQLEKQQDKVKTARGKSGEAREAYVTKVLAARNAADKVAIAWGKVATDAEGTAALAKVAEVLKKNIPPKASPTFTLNEKQLATLEQKILSETIKLTEDGGTFLVSVLIDGKHTKEMVVDSGATAISLPFALAKEMGLEPESGDRKVRVSLADGSEVEGFLKSIPSVRVGKFTVEDVECIVLSPAAVKAPPLLGMSFLGNFKFEIDKDKAELKMVKIDQDATAKK